MHLFWRFFRHEHPLYTWYESRTLLLKYKATGHYNEKVEEIEISAKMLMYS